MISYRERLTPRWWLLAVVALLGACLGIFALPFSAFWAGVCAVFGAAALSLAVWFASPLVTVSRSGEGPTGIELRCSAAHIDVAHLGRARVLGADELHDLIGLRSSDADFVCHSPWVAGAIEAPVTDEADPMRAWIVYSRTPDRLVRALTSAQDAHSEQMS